MYGQTPNNDFGGLSFQQNSGVPSQPSMQAPPYSLIGRNMGTPIDGDARLAPMLHNQPGKMTNATIEYSVLVPAVTKTDQLLISDIKEGVLVFDIRTSVPLRVPTLPNKTSTYLGNRTPHLKGTSDQIYEVVSWDFLSRDSMDKEGNKIQNATLMLAKPHIIIPSDSKFWTDFKDKQSSSEKLYNNFIQFQYTTDKDRPVALKKDDEKARQSLYREVMIDGGIGSFVPSGIAINSFMPKDIASDSFSRSMLNNAMFTLAVKGTAICTSWSNYKNGSPQYALTAGYALYIMVVGTVSSDNNKFENIRFQRTTSVELYSYCRLINTALGLEQKDYILGAWYVATVKDTAASRKEVNGRIQAAQFNALETNVDIHWIEAHEMYDRFGADRDKFIENQKRDKGARLETQQASNPSKASNQKNPKGSMPKENKSEKRSVDETNPNESVGNKDNPEVAKVQKNKPK